MAKIKSAYDLRIKEKQRGYEVTLKIIGTTIKRMIDMAIISDNIKISGRIKSLRSTYENILKVKRLDDFFGIRIVAETEEELNQIRKALEGILEIKRSKIHGDSSSTSYNALHQTGRVITKLAEANNMNPEDFPLIEVQYWTREMEKRCVHGELAYSKYKGRDVNMIRQMLKYDPKSVYDKLPIFYEISSDNIRRLYSEEAVLKMYPEIEKLPDEKTPDECSV